MADFDMSVIGLDLITDFMEQCQKNDAKLLRKATIAGARVILRAAKRNCSRFKYPTGNLEKSLKIKVVKPKYEGKQAIVVGPEVGLKAKNDGWYGRLVEGGHKTRRKVSGKFEKIDIKRLTELEYGTSEVAPQPFLRPAYDENQEAAYQKTAEVYGREWGNKTIADDIDTFGDVIVESLGGGKR